MDKVRVLFCIDSVEVDAGTEKQLEEWILRMDRERFELHLCCFEDSERLRDLSRVCRTLILPVASLLRPNALRQIWRLRRYIDGHVIDVVHTFFVRANVVGVLAARGSRCKAIVSSRLNMGYWFTANQIRMLRYLDRYTTRIMANAERVKQFVVETEHVSPDMVDVVYNRVDTKRYVPNCGDPSVVRALGVPDGAKIVGVVANLRPVKDHALFLRAAKLVADRVPEAAFVLVGRGTLLEDLQRMAADLGIAEKVFFPDGRGSVLDFLGQMSVGCLSSVSEGFSNTILEYMAAGLPVVATDVGGAREAVEHGRTGFVVPHGDPEAFANALVQLLTDDAGRAEMGRRSLERCRQLFDLELTARELEEYFVKLAQGVRQ
jgi:L-malate glycosyltransferase